MPAFPSISWAVAGAALLLAVSPVRAESDNDSTRGTPSEVCCPDTVVYPTGDAVRDLAAVQAAVEGGGTVRLKARDTRGRPRAFNFGTFPAGFIEWNPVGPVSGFVALGLGGEIVPLAFDWGTLYVSVGNDVRLVGEVVRGARTTIEGGTVPIRNFADRPIPGGGSATVFGLGSVTIEGVRFVGSALQSIYTTQLSVLPEVRALLEARHERPRFEIRGNEFIEVKPALSYFLDGGQVVPTVWYALGAVTDGPQGTVRLDDNLLQFAAGRWAAEQRAFEAKNGFDALPEIWEGFSIADLQAHADIEDNTVRGVDVGLLVYFSGKDFVRIARNWVELRPEGFVGIGCYANHTYVVEDNTVKASGANPDGIILLPSESALGINDSSVRHNRIVLDGSDFGGISLIGAGARNRFSDNRIEGSGAYALGLVQDAFAPEGLAEGNRFTGNQLSGFTPRDSQVYGEGVHVFFDVNTRNNFFAGNPGTVRDLGEGNVFRDGH